MPSDAEEDSSEGEELGQVVGGRVKTYRHVPARVDQDWYQCTVPEGLLQQTTEQAADNAKAASINWHKGTRGVNSRSSEKAIEEFLVYVRNLFEPARFQDEEFWSVESVQACPLESDAEVIEFLADHDYNVEKAVFHLSTLMNYGKDIIHTAKLTDYTAKFPSAQVFHEVKEKVLRAGAQKQMLGAYLNLELDEKGFSLSTPDNQPVVDEDSKQASLSEGSWENSRDYFRVPFPRDFAEGRPIELVRIPKPVEKPEEGKKKSSAAEKAAEKAAAAAAAAAAVATTSEASGSETAAATADADAAKEADKTLSSDDGSAGNRAVRTGVVDKQEAKKRWLSILKKGTDLTQKAKPVEGVMPSKAKRGTIEEVQAILEEASTLPPFTDAPGDDFAEVLRSLLADLMKQMMAAREYVAKVRDTLAPHFATYGKRANVFLSVAELKKLQNEGNDMPIQTVEERHLRDMLATVERTNKFAKKLQSKSGLRANDEAVIPEDLVDNEEGEGEGGEKAEKGEEGEKGKRGEKSSKRAAAKRETAPENKPALDEVSENLRILDALPLDRTATKVLKDVYQQALRLVDQAADYVESANSFRNRSKVRGAGDPARSLDECKKLMERMTSFSVDLAPYFRPLEKLYNDTLAWREEVQNLVKNAGPSGRSSSATADGNKPGSSSIKRVEALINEGERMIFDLTTDLEALRDKRSQAREWLEKLKKSFAPKVGSRGLRKNNLDSSAAVPVERLALADMKMMVQEGEALYDDDKDDGRSKTLRELSRAQAAVDVAEEWISRVRDAMCDSSMDMESMKELLGESEEMPVFMEEAVVLRVHLHALEWASKAKYVIYEIDEDEENRMDEEEAQQGEQQGVEGENPDNGVPRPSRKRVFARPKLIEVQRLAKEIKKIREELPESIREEYLLKPLPEEKDVMLVVKSAEEFTSQMKRLFQANIPRKGIKLDKLRELFHKGVQIPLQFDNEMRPLKTSIRVCESWLGKNAPLLTKMGIPCNLTRTIDVEYVGDREVDVAGEEEGAEAGTVAMAEAKIPVDMAGWEAKDVTLEDWRRLVSTADHIVLEFDELTKARNYLEDMDDWMQLVMDRCPKRFVASLGGSKKDKDKDKKPIAVSAPSGPRANGWPSKFLVKKTQMEDLLARGETLVLDLKKEKQAIKDAIAFAERWNEEGQKALNEIITNRLQPLAVKYRQLALDGGLPAIAMAFTGMSKSVSSAYLHKKASGSSYSSAEEEGAEEKKIYNEVLAIVNASVQGRKKGLEDLGAPAGEKIPEEVLWQEVMVVKQELESLQLQGEEIGISCPATLAIDLCTTAILWIIDVRDMLNPARRRKGLLDADGDPDPKDSLEWGDMRKDHIMLLIDDAMLIVSQEVREETEAALASLKLSSAPRYMSEALAEHNRIKEEIWPEEKAFMTLFSRKTPHYRSAAAAEVKGKKAVAAKTLQAAATAAATAAAAATAPTASTAAASATAAAAEIDPLAAAAVEIDEPEEEPEDAAFMEVEVPIAPTHVVEEQEEQEDEHLDDDAGGDAGPSRKKANSSSRSVGFGTVEVNVLDGRPARKRQRSSFLDMDLGSIEKKSRPSSKSKVAEMDDGSAKAAPLESVGKVKEVKEKPDKADKAAKAEKLAEKLAEIEEREREEKEHKPEPVPPPARHFQLFRKLMANTGVTVPVSLQRVVDFYVRCLGVLLQRVFEAEQWSTMAQTVLTKSTAAAPGSSSKRCIEECAFLLEWATSRGIECSMRHRLEEAVIAVDEWVARVNAMRKREVDSLMNVEDLREFARQGERLLLDRPETYDVREEIKKAKVWIKKLQASGLDKGTALNHDLQALLPETDAINVDLSFYMDQIYTAVKSYCLCRQAFFGQMIGCDTCDDWYHLQCIGITQQQADRCDKFVCIRCNIKQSFEYCQNLVGSTANKWMNMGELHKDRDAKKLKLQKRTQREQKEIERLEKRLDELIAQNAASPVPNQFSLPAASVAPVAPLPPAPSDLEESLNPSAPDAMVMGMGGTSALAESIGDVPALGLVPSVQPGMGMDQQTFPAQGSEHIVGQQTSLSSVIKTVSSELDQARERHEQSSVEEATHTELSELEDSRQPEVIVWMQKIQAVMWPANSKDQDLGRPCGRDVIPQEQSFTVEDVQDRALTHLRTNLLPAYLFEMARSGINAGIGDIEDIVTVIEAFRWMSWCNVTLQVIRIPLTTVLLRKLVSAGEGLKMHDEKLLRFFRFLNMRAIAWKSKARKLLWGTNLTMDTARLNGLLLEGNQIPISSRIKDVLRSAMEKIIAATKPAYGEETFVLPAIDPDTALAVGLQNPNKRPPKGTVVAGSGVGTPMYATLSHDPPNSSDEESKAPQRSSIYNTIPHLKLTQHVIFPTMKLWPPIIPFSRSNGQTPTAPPPAQPVYQELGAQGDESAMLIAGQGEPQPHDGLSAFAMPSAVSSEPAKRGRKPAKR